MECNEDELVQISQELETLDNNSDLADEDLSEFVDEVDPLLITTNSDGCEVPGEVMGELVLEPDSESSHDNDSAPVNQPESDDTSEAFPCFMCTAVFKDQNEMITHVSDHHGVVARPSNMTSDSKKGDEDEYNTNKPSVILDNSDTSETFPCFMCTTVFKDQNEMISHVSDIHGVVSKPAKATLAAEEDDRVAGSDNAIKPPSVESSNSDSGTCETFPCFMCTTVFKSQNEMISHVSDIHGVVARPAKTTPAAERGNKADSADNAAKPSKEELSNADAGASETFPCFMCTTVFKDQNEMISHVSDAHDVSIKPSNKTSANKKGINGAKNNDNTEKPLRVESDKPDTSETFPCFMCTTVFKDQKEMLSHVSDLHGVAVRLPSKISATEKSDQDTSAHTFDEPSSVDSENSRPELKQCGICSKKFPDLEHHIKTTHKNRKFLCTECGARFDKHRDKILHMLEMHSKSEKSITKASLRPIESNGEDILVVGVKGSARKSSVLNVDSKENVRKIFNVKRNYFPCFCCLNNYTNKADLEKHYHQDHQLFKINLDCRPSPDKVMNMRSSIKVRPDLMPNEKSSGPRTRSWHEPKSSKALMYPCFACTETYSDRSVMLDHVQNFHGISVRPGTPKRTKVSCPKCEESFDTDHDLQDHVKRYHKTQRTPTATSLPPKRLSLSPTVTKKFVVYPCSICSASFSASEDLTGHFKTKHGKSIEVSVSKENPKDLFPCFRCDRVSKSKEEMMIHVRDIHGVNISKKPREIVPSIPKQKGSKLSDKPQRLIPSKSPQTQRSNAIPCFMCKDTFTQSSDMLQHIKLAHGISHATVPESGKIEPPKPVEAPAKIEICFLCDETFINGKNLVDHLLNGHNVRKDKIPLPLRKHLNEASDEENRYCCGLCHKNFTREMWLQHMRVNHGVNIEEGKNKKPSKPEVVEEIDTNITDVYPCHRCPKWYTFQPSLLSHLRREHKLNASQLINTSTSKTNGSLESMANKSKDKVIYPFKCSMCPSYRSSNRLNMLEHLKLAHGKEVNNPNNNLKILSCSQCDFKTSELRKLQDHSKMHVIICRLCNTVAKSHQDLKDHMWNKHHFQDSSKRGFEDVTQDDEECVPFKIARVEGAVENEELMALS